MVRLWLSGGRPLPKPLKIEIKMQLSRLPDSPALQDSLREVDEAIEDYSPVLGRWKADNSPRDNMLFFMSRTPQVGAAQNPKGVLLRFFSHLPPTSKLPLP